MILLSSATILSHVIPGATFMTRFLRHEWGSVDTPSRKRRIKAVMKILTAAEMGATDARTVSDYGISFAALMENAGSAVARFVRRELPNAQSIVVLCGKGNNGGDGFVAARHLARSGCEVTVLLLGQVTGTTGEAREMLEALTHSAHRNHRRGPTQS